MNKFDGLSRDKKIKRVKTHHARSTPSSRINVCKDVFQVEENANVESCCTLYRETCEKIRSHLFSILVSKREHLCNVDSSKERTDVCMLVLKLKKLSRLDKHLKKKSKDAVNECKQKVDALNLQYQNLLYEVTHLQKEVTKCLEFRSKDEDIELVPIDEFFSEAPEHISRPVQTKTDVHELTMARLLWEFEQRKSYSQKLKEAEVIKEDYIKKIKKLKEQHSSILPTLSSIIEATEPLQSRFGMPFQAMLLEHKTADFLPQPLYILYVQACAFKDACDKNLQVSVDGNVDEAKLLQLKVDDLSDESDSDQEEIAESNLRRRSVRKEDPEKDILKKHPMSVLLTIEVDGSTIVIAFMFLIHLQIVTVSVKSVSPHSLSPQVVGDLLELSTFLHFLFPNDGGKETPNLTNIYLFKKNGQEKSPFTWEKTGWPYLWAQKLSGFEFLPQSRDDSGFGSVYMESVVKAIKLRLIARTQLTQQITAIVQKSNIPPEFSSLYPSNIASYLTKWSVLQWRDLPSYAKSDTLLDLKIVSKDNLYFCAEICRNSAHLPFVISIPPDFPSRKPVFLFQQSEGSSFNLRELEEEMNVHFLEALPQQYFPSLLVCQVYHLRACYDVFLETSLAVDGQSEIVKEKVVSRNGRGKSHSRPYKCVANQNIFTFR